MSLISQPKSGKQYGHMWDVYGQKGHHGCHAPIDDYILLLGAVGIVFGTFMYTRKKQESIN